MDDFNYNRHEEKNTLIIELPNRLTFNAYFLMKIDMLLNECLTNDDVKKIKLHCPDFVNYDSMTKAYIINVLTYIKEQSEKRIFINHVFRKRIQEEVSTKEGRAFKKETDIEELIKSQESEYYMFKGKEEITRPVNHISSLLAIAIPSFDQDELKDFLNTTIGEIFSNSTNHSNQENVFFASFVQKNGEDIFLYVSIIDYGTTIVSNVRRFLDNQDMKASDCIAWAIKPANTTRKGSGGYGLPTLIDYLKATNGELYIFSGTACYFLLNTSGEATEEVKGGYFPGTSVAFKVKLNQNSFIIKCYNGNKKVDSISLKDI